jgi:hypothetical protein
MLTVSPLNSESHRDRANVLRVFVGAPLYTEIVEGRPPPTEDVDDFFYGKPASKDAADKSVFGFYVGPDMIGCADVVRSYPAEDCLWIRVVGIEHHDHHNGK